MKILFAGNLVNVNYHTVKQLRKDGIDAELLLDPSGTNDPVNIDSNLKNGYPDWFHIYDRKKSNWKLVVIKTMRNKKFDLIHASAELPIFTNFSRKPFIVQALGSDFRELWLENSIKGKLLKRAYRKSKVILFSMPDHIPIYKKSGLKNGIFLPLIVDTSIFTPQIIQNNPFKDKFVILHATSLIWNIKGNDLLINGFAEFIKKYPNSLLIIIERGIDSKRTRSLVHSLNLSDKVKFVNGPLDRVELLRYYNLSDVVADEFILPAMSGITNEALCCGKPVITCYPKDDFAGVYTENPPIFNANNSIEICKQLELLTDKKRRKEIGKKGREWIIKNNNPHIYSLKLKIIYESVLHGDNIDKIRENLKKITPLRSMN